EVLGAFPRGAEGAAGPVRIPVQDVYKFDERRIIVGRLESGRLQLNDEVQVWPSGQRARVSSCEGWPGTAATPSVLETRQPVGLVLDRPLFIQRGDVLADPESPPQVSSLVAANVRSEERRVGKGWRAEAETADDNDNGEQ